MALALYLMIGGAIAWLAPFDRLFDLVTLGAPAMRVALIWTLTLAGAAAARSCGLRTGLAGAGGPLLGALAVAAAVGAWCAAVDGLTPRSVIPAPYVWAMVHEPIGVRLTYYLLRAFNENILYRLFLTSALVWGISRALPSGAPRSIPDPRVAVAAILIAQALNVGANVTFAGGPVTAGSLAYDGLRFVLPGAVWGVLYWRSGFLANEVACTSTHLVFQPLVTLALSPGL